MHCFPRMYFENTGRTKSDRVSKHSVKINLILGNGEENENENTISSEC